MEPLDHKPLLRLGQPVEVRKPGTSPVWRPARITVLHPGTRLVVDYETGGQETIKTTTKTTLPAGDTESNRVRPPPPCCPNRSDWRKGLRVDAYRDTYWQEGVLMEAPTVSSSHVIVFFPDDGEKHEFGLDTLRVSQDWDEASGAWSVKGYDPFSEWLPEASRKPQRTFQRKKKRKDVEAPVVDECGTKRLKQEENGTKLTSVHATLANQGGVEYVDVEPMQGVEESEEKDMDSEDLCLTTTLPIPVCCVNTQSEDPLFELEPVRVMEEVGTVFDSSSQGSFSSGVRMNLARVSRRKRKIAMENHRRDSLREARENAIRNLESSGWRKAVRERQRENRTSHEAYYIAPDGSSYHSLTSACAAWVEENKDVSKPVLDAMRSYQMQIVVRRSSPLGEPCEESRKARSKKSKNGGDNPSKGRPRLNALFLTPARGKADGPRRMTMFSWLLDAAVVSENAAVSCLDEECREVAKGVVTKDGILCKCCNAVFNMREFQLHGDPQGRRTASRMFLEDGRSLLDCQKQALQKSVEPKPEQPAAGEQVNADDSDECCGLCGEGGELICCDSCPATFHLHCILLKSLPEGDWFCPKCRCPVCGTSQFDEREVVFCSQCERSYHVDCLRDGGLSSSKGRFCSQACLKIFCGLRDMVGITNPMDGGFTWTMLRSAEQDDEADVEIVADHSSKLALGLTVMQECFSPMIDPRRKVDIIGHILKNRSSDVKRLDFRGFYCFFLEKKDELISVAAIRVHGTNIAEMPLIGTRLQYRRKGMCRRLMEVIEQVLRSLNVDTLVLPAVPELLETWISAFGFQKVTPFQSVRLLEFSIVGFPGTKVLQKPLAWLNLCRRLAPPLAERPWAPGSALEMGIDPEPHRKPRQQRLLPALVKTEELVGVPVNQHSAVFEAVREEAPALKEESTEDSRIVVAKTRSNRLVKPSKRVVEALKSEVDPTARDEESADVENTSELSFLKLGSSHIVMENVTAVGGGRSEIVMAEVRAPALASWNSELQQQEQDGGIDMVEEPVVENENRKEETAEQVVVSKVKVKKCAECGTSETPMWRKGPADNSLLCNACGIRWKKMYMRLAAAEDKEDKEL